ncbi:MAG: hypothetical protein ACLUVC_14635 [Longibaculum sp.]
MKQRNLKLKKLVRLKDLMKCWNVFTNSLSCVDIVILKGERIASRSNDRFIDTTALDDLAKFVLKRQTIEIWTQQSDDVTNRVNENNDTIYHHKNWNCIDNSYDEIC